MDKAQNLFDRIAEAVAAVLPDDVSQDVRQNLKASVRGACESLNLVTREELEVQEAVLQRTREKVEKLEAQVGELEQLLQEKGADGLN